MATLFSIKEALTYAWKAYTADPLFYSGVTLVLTLASMLLNGLTSQDPSVVLGIAVSLVLSTFVTIAYSTLALSVREGTHAVWRDLWAPEHFWRVLGVSLLQALIVTIGFILLIIPGIIVALMLSLSQLVAVDKKLGPVAALKESYRLTKGQLFQLFILAVILAAMNIAGALALGVGLLVSIPVSMIAYAHVYRKLNGLQGVPLAPASGHSSQHADGDHDIH